jgi:hypothetical protein
MQAAGSFSVEVQENLKKPDRVRNQERESVLAEETSSEVGDENKGSSHIPGFCQPELDSEQTFHRRSPALQTKAWSFSGLVQDSQDSAHQTLA